MLVVGGAADMASAAFRTSMLQSAASDAVRGRLQGVFIVVVAGGPRIADVRARRGRGVIGTALTAALGGVLVVVGLARVRRRSRRRSSATALEDPEPRPVTPAPTCVRDRGGGRLLTLLHAVPAGLRQGRVSDTGTSRIRFDARVAGPVSFLRLPPRHLERGRSGARLIFENSTVCLSMNWFV